jgi:hypothetical protein
VLKKSNVDKFTLFSPFVLLKRYLQKVLKTTLFIFDKKKKEKRTPMVSKTIS